jgi:hypothetical protein
VHRHVGDDRQSYRVPLPPLSVLDLAPIVDGTAIHDHAARLRSYELLGQLRVMPG